MRAGSSLAPPEAIDCLGQHFQTSNKQQPIPHNGWLLLAPAAPSGPGPGAVGFLRTVVSGCVSTDLGLLSGPVCWSAAAELPSIPVPDGGVARYGGGTADPLGRRVDPGAGDEGSAPGSVVPGAVSSPVGDALTTDDCWPGPTAPCGPGDALPTAATDGGPLSWAAGPACAGASGRGAGMPPGSGARGLVMPVSGRFRPRSGCAEAGRLGGSGTSAGWGGWRSAVGKRHVGGVRVCGGGVAGLVLRTVGDRGCGRGRAGFA